MLHLPGFFLRSGDAGLQAELVPGLHRPELGPGQCQETFPGHTLWPSWPLDNTTENLEWLGQPRGGRGEAAGTRPCTFLDRCFMLVREGCLLHSNYLLPRHFVRTCEGWGLLWVQSLCCVAFYLLTAF